MALESAVNVVFAAELGLVLILRGRKGGSEENFSCSLKLRSGEQAAAVPLFPAGR